MGKKFNRLAKRPTSVLSIRIDREFQYVLKVLMELEVFQTQSEAIYQAVYELANRMGIRAPLGGSYEVLPTFDMDLDTGDLNKGIRQFVGTQFDCLSDDEIEVILERWIRA